ncbi:MAG: rhamnulose-1-phosphate aldolase [Bacillota bacterium]|nr:rhamnulose-1-phosphate aldolase [Bacillota bacterium]
MKDILKAPFLTEFCDIADNMYRMGWDERNGGNISLILDPEEVKQYLDLDTVKKWIPITFHAVDLAGKIFLVTGTGKYFRNVLKKPADCLGIIKVAEDGKSIGILWGFEDGGRPTSELPAHFMSHIERLKVDPKHRIVIHTHATNVVAMTFVHDLSEREFTRTLWQMCTECLVVFPDGVGVLPWMLCGNDEIGRATAEKMKEYRLVVWGQHGIFGTGRDIDEAFGLIETVEKAAEIYIKVMNHEIKQSITDEQLWILANAFHVTPKEGFLNK